MHRAIQLTLFSLFFFIFSLFFVLLFLLVDPCFQYKTLNSPDRNVNYTDRPLELLCDNPLPFSQGVWYRFQGAAGTRLPTKCPPNDRCHTKFPGWLNVTDKPLPPEGVTERNIKVCFKLPSDNNCCALKHLIHIRNCSSYFVYMLVSPPTCNLRYCGTN